MVLAGGGVTAAARRQERQGGQHSQENDELCVEDHHRTPRPHTCHLLAGSAHWVVQSIRPVGCGGSYYRHWLNALERLCAAKGLAPEDAVLERTEEWRQAYLDTPHGKPVVFRGRAG